MSLEKLEYPATGAVTDSVILSRNPRNAGAPDDLDLNISREISAGALPYNFGAPKHTKRISRAYDQLTRSERDALESFFSYVGGAPLKFTDYNGIPWRVTLDDFRFRFDPVRADRWNVNCALRADLAPPPSLRKIPDALKRYLLLYLPLGDASIVSRFAGALACVRNSIATYIDPADGLVKQVAANAPRFEANGLLIEPGRTNSALWVDDFSNAAWVKSNITVGANDAGTLDPAGAQTADLLTASAANGTALQTLTLASASKVFSPWLKRKTGTGNVDITLDNGATWTTVAISSSVWTRVSKVQTQSNPVFGIRMVASGDAVWVWRGQLEDSALFATSGIPTTTAAAARAADDLRIGEAGHILPAAGTVIFSADVLATDAGADAYQFIDAAALAGDTGIEIVSDSNAVRARVFSGGSAVASLTGGGNFTAGVAKKIGLAWKANDFRLVVDGVEVASDSAGAAPTAFHGTSLFLGQRSDGSRRLAGHIKELMTFATALTSADIISIHGGL